jgi:hypothetical protein
VWGGSTHLRLLLSFIFVSLVARLAAPRAISRTTSPLLVTSSCGFGWVWWGGDSARFQLPRLRSARKHT